MSKRSPIVCGVSTLGYADPGRRGSRMPIVRPKRGRRSPVLPVDPQEMQTAMGAAFVIAIQAKLSAA
jgi:hypothetical protein